MDKLEAYTNKIRDIADDQDSEEDEIKSSIEAKYSDKISNVKLMISQYNDDLKELNNMMSSDINNAIKEYQVKQPKYNLEFLNILELLMNGAKLFFVEDSIYSAPFEEAINDEHDFFSDSSRLPDELNKVIYDWIRKHLVIKNAEGIKRLEGTPKGYKGKDTEFECTNEPPYITEHSDAIAYHREDWDSYFDHYPKSEDIDHDPKECRMTAVIRQDVTLIFKIKE